MSRLDRLVVLLETGLTPFIRNTAADQLSDLAKGHPEEIISLLGRVYPFLKADKWETRIAAAKAFGGIASHAAQWDPNSHEAIEKEKQLQHLEDANSAIRSGQSEPKVKIEQDEELRKLDESISSLVSFDSWDLYLLLKSGKKLLASGGLEFEPTTKKSHTDDISSPEDSLFSKIKQHKLFIKPEDNGRVKTEPTESITPKLEHPKMERQDSLSQSPPPPAADHSSSTDAPKSAAASARLKAMQKRKAKVTAKSSANKIAPVDLLQSSISRKLVEDGEGTDVKVKSEDNQDPNFDITSQQGGSKLVMESKAPELSPLLSQHAKVAGLVWQFQGVYELLLTDLFDEKWEIRHGSALGLRELIKVQGKGAGRVMNKSKQENDNNNKATLQDLAVRLCSLFALDRFADYVNDTVVAPVRESGAQTLAALLIHLDLDTIIKTFNCLQTLVLQDWPAADDVQRCWEAKHGGMLGVRYFVSVRTDVLLSQPGMLDSVVAMVLHCLKESEDDVQSVAALALAPIAGEFVKTRREVIVSLLQVVWECLWRFEDDLSASIGSVMDLLSRLCTHPNVIEIMQAEAAANEANSFENLVPKLFPFLRHSITNVRKATLNTLLEFLSINDPFTKTWISSKALRLILQNLLVEQNSEILTLSERVYFRMIKEVPENPNLESVDVLFGPHIQPLLSLLMTPIGIARHNYHLNTSLIMKPNVSNFTTNGSTHRDSSPDVEIFETAEPDSGSNNNNNNNNNNGTGNKESSRRGRKRKTEEKVKPAIPSNDDLRINIDAPIQNGDVMFIGYDTLVATRVALARAYGYTMALVSDQSVISKVFDHLKVYMASPHATPSLLSAIVLEEYANAMKEFGKTVSAEVAESFSKIMFDALAEPDNQPFFRELVPKLKSVRTSCLQLFDVFLTNGKLPQTKLPQLPVVVQGETGSGPGAFGIDSAEKLVNETYAKLMKSLSSSNRILAHQALEDSKHRILVALNEAKIAQTQRLTSIMACYAATLLVLTGVPQKLNPIIRSLMDSIKLEETELLQLRSARSIAQLIRQLNEIGKSGAANKIVKNLCAFICVDTSEVPEFVHNYKFTDNILSLRKEEARTDPTDIKEHEKAVAEARVKRNGALLSMDEVINVYKEAVFEKLPKLKSLLFEPLEAMETASEEEVAKEDNPLGQSIIDSLGVIRALLPKLGPSLQQEVSEQLPKLLSGLKHPLSVLRYSLAKCFATICSLAPAKAFPFLVRNIVPMLNNAGKFRERQGAIEAIYHISSTMGADILPYIVFLLVPVLGRMSDADQDVRILASTTFASIIKLVPLEAGIPDPPDMPQDLMEGRERERDFIQQMMDPTKIKPFELPVAIKATLRRYQQEGVNWLAFLNKYHLHGILCDDMGLGKTLQTICIIASDHHIRADKFKETGSDEFRRLPTIIVCPPSVTGHWEQEINQYAPFMKTVVYAGGPSVRSSIREQIPTSDVVVTSYDVCRNDIDVLLAHAYNYCVLDEGHIIKNSASKLTKSVKRIKAEHRLILSGTPIQNNVLELWSLFDFLMPGFLGTEKVFMEKFSKPIAASRNSKTSSKEQEAGALALESLHRQVLPFMLRRLKEDVLSDLPPKIIQDYYCELSDLQKKLYKEFAQKQKTIVKDEVTKEEVVKEEPKTHVFQALQYMRKLCNHPALVITPNHPQAAAVKQYLAQRKSDIHDIDHSPKLKSLKTLLLECGIGVGDSEYKGSSGSKSKKQQQQQQQQQLISSEGVISEHRALIFCQLKDMVDIVEDELLKKHMPSVTYMRLDGRTDPRERQAVVRKFNEDPSIDVLLLTTKVGGLGLNLTGADTVIFVEHDWNPMNDLQAMDRAHRLGQKRVVNVYRLITKGTLEEKIMGLQKFKMNIASTIVNQQNAGLLSMDTNQLLDLFDVEEVKETETEKEKKVPDELMGVPGDVELGQLWDELQYEDEYNLDNFIKTLK